MADKIGIIIFIVVTVITVISRAINAAAQKNPPPRQPLGQPPQQPMGGGAPGTIQSEIERFLRQVQQKEPVVAQAVPAPEQRREEPRREEQQRKKSKKERQRNQSREGQARPQQLRDRHAIEDEVRTKLDTQKFERHTRELSKLDDNGPSELQRHVNETFNHQLGQIAEPSAATVATDDAPKVMQSRTSRPKLTPLQIRQAFIVQEILQRYDERPDLFS
jgi:hypothetical protein